MLCAFHQFGFLNLSRPMHLFSDDDRSTPPSPSRFGREVVDEVWNQAETIPGNDDALWRKDPNGTWINRLDYGKRNSQFGWVIEEKASDLLPIQWESASAGLPEEDEPEEEEGMLF